MYIGYEIWSPKAEFPVPGGAVAKFGETSSSSGGFGPDRLLFLPGLDAQGLYVLDLPVEGDAWTWKTAIPISAHGQAFAWDRSTPSLLYSIDRKTKEVIVSKIIRR